jgi:5-dehydro-4-deoxyglucarate dehydratase
MSIDPNTLKKTLGSGLLAFPVTHFKPDLSFDEQPYRSSIHRNIEHGAVGLLAPAAPASSFS